MQLRPSRVCRAAMLLAVLQVTFPVYLFANEQSDAQQRPGSDSRLSLPWTGAWHGKFDRRSASYSIRQLAWQQRHHHRPHKRPAVHHTLQDMMIGAEQQPPETRPSPASASSKPSATELQDSQHTIHETQSLTAPESSEQLHTAEAIHQKCSPLTAEKLAAAAVNFTVMLMVSDYSTAPDLLHHWLGNVQAANIRYYVVAAADDATCALLVQQGLQDRCYRLAGTEQRTASHGYAWASEQWKDATWLKVPAALELLRMGYNVILSDIDVMWLADPMPFMLNDTQADFLISLDAHYSEKAAGDADLESFNIGRLMNTGVYFARARKQVIDMFEQWLALRGFNHDQEAFKQLMNSAGPVEPVPGNDRLGRVLGGTVVMGQLPLSSFMHGYSYSVMQLHKLSNTPPYEVHMIFGYGHKASKVYKLRDAGLGHDSAESEYYTPPGGVLTFDIVPAAVPIGFSGWSVEDLSHTEDDMEIHHNRAVDFQLQQLYHAMGLALALNRTLVMPAMQCFCARGWYPNDNCRLPGDRVSTLPFRCTGDQIFNVEALMNPSVTVGGVLLRVRPPSFATDPRLPAQYLQLNNRLTVAPGDLSCQPEARSSTLDRRALLDNTPADGNLVGTAADTTTNGASDDATSAGDNTSGGDLHDHIDGGDGNAEGATSKNKVQGSSSSACIKELQPADGSKQLVVPSAYSGEQMSQLFEAHADVKWLHFTNVTAAFSGFKEPSKQQAFEALLKSIVAEWCCRRADRVKSAGVPDGHLHQIRRWGSPQRFCARRLESVGHGDRVHSYFC